MGMAGLMPPSQRSEVRAAVRRALALPPWHWEPLPSSDEIGDLVNAADSFRATGALADAEHCYARAAEAIVGLRDAAAISDADRANALLRCDGVARCLSALIRVCLQAKLRRFGEAWDTLCDAEAAVDDACAVKPLDAWVSAMADCVATIRETFPPQLFNSLGMTVEKMECTICGGNPASCPHIAGRVYSGRRAARRITQYSLQEVSIVLDAANPRCRAVPADWPYEQGFFLTSEEATRLGEAGELGPDAWQREFHRILGGQNARPSLGRAGDFGPRLISYGGG